MSWCYKTYTYSKLRAQAKLLLVSKQKGGPGFPNMKDNAEDFLGTIFVVLLYVSGGPFEMRSLLQTGTLSECVSELACSGFSHR